jgi:excinuclease ABC subunit B
VIVVASVSCIYGIGNPAEFHKSVVHVKRGQKISRNKLLHQFVSALVQPQGHAEPGRGNFRVRGDVVEVYLAYADEGMRIHFWGDEIEKSSASRHGAGRTWRSVRPSHLPREHLRHQQGHLERAPSTSIQEDMVKQVDFFNEIGKHLEAKR